MMSFEHNQLSLALPSIWQYSELSCEQFDSPSLHLTHGDPWVFGALVNNVWSTGTNPIAAAYSNGLVQPFVNYNFTSGFYLVSGPIITVNWKADSDQAWTVPLGGGIGRIFHLGKLPVNTSLQGYYNVVQPDFGPNWQLRAQVQLMFPK